MKNFFSEEQPKNYGDMYKNFAGLIENVNSNVLGKLDGEDDRAVADKNPDATAKNPNAESSSSIHRYFYVAFMLWQHSCNQSKFYLPVLLSSGIDIL